MVAQTAAYGSSKAMQSTYMSGVTMQYIRRGATDPRSPARSAAGGQPFRNRTSNFLQNHGRATSGLWLDESNAIDVHERRDDAVHPPRSDGST